MQQNLLITESHKSCNFLQWKISIIHRYFKWTIMHITNSTYRQDVVPALNYLSTMPWRCMGEWMYRSTFSWPRHYFGVVRFKPRSLYPRYPLDRRLGGPQNRSGHEENSCPYRDSNPDPSVVQPVSQSLYWLCYPGFRTPRIYDPNHRSQIHSTYIAILSVLPLDLTWAYHSSDYGLCRGVVRQNCTDVSQKRIASRLFLEPAYCWFLASLTMRPWRWRHDVPSKRWWSTKYMALQPIKSHFSALLMWPRVR
jgi:hypothetical protein